MSQPTHLKNLARIRSLFAVEIVLGFQDGHLTRLLLHEPDVAVALTLESRGIVGYLHRLDLPKLGKHLVNVLCC